MESKLNRKLRELDLSSTFAFVVGLSAMTISIIVAVITFFKLIEQETNAWVSLGVAIVVFYVFSQVYTFIILLGLKYFLRNQNKL
jgi:uncharacterized membrane protein YdcZ (DUF606 family)